MLRKLMSERAESMHKEKVTALLIRRWAKKRETGDSQLHNVGGPVDVHGVVKLLRDDKAAVPTRRAMLALAWGVFPTGVWLNAHGWQVCGECPECGQEDGAERTVLGCPAVTPPELLESRRRA